MHFRRIKLYFSMTLLCLTIFQAAALNGEEKVKYALLQKQVSQKIKGEVDAIKFMIPEDGLYKVTYRQMKDLGIAPEEIDFYNTSLSANGKEYPFLIHGYEDGSLDRNDYIVFYGRKPRGEYTYRYKFADNNVYRLEFNRKGMMNRKNVYHQGEANLPASGDVLMREIHFEEDTSFNRFTHPFGVDTDFSFYFPIHWAMNKNHRWVFFDLPGINHDASNFMVKVRAYVYGRSQENISGKKDHNLEYSINEYYIGERHWNGYKEDLFEKNDVPPNIFEETENRFDFKLIPTDGVTIDHIMFDWFEIEYPVKSEAINEFLPFKILKGHYKQTREIKISNFNNENIYLYNSSTDTFIEPSVKENPGKGYVAAFAANQTDTEEYFIASEAGLFTPPEIKLSKYMGLRTPDNSARYVIISHENFLSQAQRLADYRNKRGISTILVPVENIYDEFNYSLAHPRAIKDAIAYFYNNWKTPQLKYALFVGDWSWDWHNLLNTHKQNFIPTWYVPHFKIEYATDTYFSSVDDDFIPEVALGRLPVKTISEAETTINKIINYELNFTDDAWRHKIMLTASADTQFHAFSDEIAQKYLADNYSVQKAYCDPTSPLLVTQEVIDACNEGLGMLVYSGHGSRYYWLTATSLGHTSQDWEYNFQPEKIDEIHNPHKLPIVFAATCFTNNFDNPAERNCIGEKFLIKENGGALGVIASSSYSYIENDEMFVEKMFDAAFLDDQRLLGDIFLYGAQNCPSEEAVKMFMLLGDPCSRHGLLPIPEGSEQLKQELEGGGVVRYF